MNIAGIHPYADQYPMLSEDDLAELTESVSQLGLLAPITVTPDGLILDGRNRWEACKRANIDPETVETDLAEPDWADFVIASNSTRRHMATGARAMAAALILTSAGRRKDGRWERGSVDIGESANSATWQARLKECGLVLDYAPDLAPAVRDGEMSLNHAYAQAKANRADAEAAQEQEAAIEAEETAALAALKESAPEYAERVGTDFTSARVALATWEDDNKAEAARRRREKADAEKKAAEERSARSDLYTGIARAVGTVGTYGGYADYGELMALFDRDELDPPQTFSYFDIAHLEAAGKFISWLIDWRASQ